MRNPTLNAGSRFLIEKRRSKSERKNRKKRRSFNGLMGWPDPYFNSGKALPDADLQKAQSFYERVKAMDKKDRSKWMRKNKGGDAIIDYVRKRIMQDVRNNEAKARQQSRR